MPARSQSQGPARRKNPSRSKSPAPRGVAARSNRQAKRVSNTSVWYADFCFIKTGDGFFHQHFDMWMTVAILIVVVFSWDLSRLFTSAKYEGVLGFLYFIVFPVVTIATMIPWTRSQLKPVCLALAVIAPFIAFKIASGTYGRGSYCSGVQLLNHDNFTSCDVKNKDTLYYALFCLQSFQPIHIGFFTTGAFFCSVFPAFFILTDANHSDMYSLLGGTIPRIVTFWFIFSSFTEYTMGLDGRSPVLQDNCGKNPVFQFLNVNQPGLLCKHAPLCIRNGLVLGLPLVFKNQDSRKTKWQRDLQSHTADTVKMAGFQQGLQFDNSVDNGLHISNELLSYYGEDGQLKTYYFWVVNVQDLRTLSHVHSTLNGAPPVFFLWQVLNFWHEPYASSWHIIHTFLNFLIPNGTGHWETLRKAAFTAFFFFWWILWFLGVANMQNTVQTVIGVCSFVASLAGKENMERIRRFLGVVCLPFGIAFYSVHSCYIHHLAAEDEVYYVYTCVLVAMRSAIMLFWARQSWLFWASEGWPKGCIVFAFLILLLHEYFVHQWRGIQSSVGALCGMVWYLVYEIKRDR